MAGGIFDVGTILAHVRLDDLLFNRNLMGVEKSLERFGNKAALLGAKMTLAITTPLTLMGRKAVKEFSDFDNALVRAQAVMDDTSQATRKALEQNVIRVSKQSNVALTELARGYYYFGQAGLTASQAIEALPVVERMAVAGAMELETATTQLLQAQNALALTDPNPTKNMENMARVSDVLTKAAIETTAEIEDFAYALTNKGAAGLRLVNKSVEEGVAVLMAFARQGVKSEEAGEKMYMMLRDVQRASILFREQWKRNNLEVYDSGGTMLNTADIIGQLEEKMKGMTDEGKRFLLMQLGFQDRSLAATQILVGLSGTIREYERALQSAGGLSKIVAERYMKSFAGQMAILKNYISAARIELGKFIAEDLIVITQFLKRLTEIWTMMSDPVKRLVVHIGLIVAALGPAIFGFGVFLKILGGIVGVVAAVLSPIGLLTAAIGFLVLRSEKASNVVGKSFGAIGNSITTILDKIKNWTERDSAVLNYQFVLIGIELESLKEKFAAFIQYLRTDWAGASKALGETLIAALKLAGTAIMDVAFRIGKGVWESVKTGIMDAASGADYKKAMEVYKKRYPDSTYKESTFSPAKLLQAGSSGAGFISEYLKAGKLTPKALMGANPLGELVNVLTETQEKPYKEAAFEKIQRELDAIKSKQIQEGAFAGMGEDGRAMLDVFWGDIDKIWSAKSDAGSKAMSDALKDIDAMNQSRRELAKDELREEEQTYDVRAAMMQAFIEKMKGLWKAVDPENKLGPAFEAIKQNFKEAQKAAEVWTMDEEEMTEVLNKLYAGGLQRSKEYFASQRSQLAYNIKLWRLNAAAIAVAMHLPSIEAANALIDQYEANQKRLLKIEEALASNNFFKGMAAGFSQMYENLGTVGQLGAQVAQDLTDGIGDALVELVNGTKDLADSFKDLAREIANMVMKWAVMKLITGVLDVAFPGTGTLANAGANVGGGGGAPGGGQIGAIPMKGKVAKVHTGGVFGMDTMAKAWVNPAVFAGAIRAHTGIGPNERPAVLTKGEGVFTPGQMKALGIGYRGDETNALLRQLLLKDAKQQVVLVDDRKSVEEYMTSREGTRTFVQVARKHRREINQ